MKRGILLLSGLVFLAVTSNALPQEKEQVAGSKADTVSRPEAANAPRQEKRSAIVEADGYAYLSEDKTIRQLREEAIANAKREALERAQTYIKSFTQVENFMLTYDLVQSEAEGYLRILESKDYGIQHDNRYRYWLKAEIQYALRKPETEASPAAIFQNPHAPLTVQVWTEKSTYSEGEEIHIFLQGNKDLYARIVYLDAGGKIVQLLPNRYREQNFFRGGMTYKIPEQSAGDRFSLKVRPPFGKERIIVYASSAAQGAAALEPSKDGLYVFRGGLSELGKQVRGVEVTASEGQPYGVEFYEARWDLVTRSKGWRGRL